LHTSKSAFMKPIQLILAGSLLFILATCKNDKEPIFSNNYVGSLYLEYSRGFPDFSKMIRMDLSMDKDGVVTFGNGGSESFGGVDTLYDEGEPVLKMEVEGSMEFNSASGRGDVIDGKEFLFIMVDSRVHGTQYIWIWDDDNQRWIEPPSGGHELPFDYSDTYSDGEMQFSVVDATLDGSSFKITFPDAEGVSTYGYTLYMSPIAK
jgi:hypothetical protein